MTYMNSTKNKNSEKIPIPTQNFYRDMFFTERFQNQMLKIWDFFKPCHHSISKETKHFHPWSNTFIILLPRT